jgi:Ni,Fe-hydrogenase I large subunit
MTIVTIDPVTRIEGHMKVEVNVDDASRKVTSAKCSATLFRGFESIVLNRDPRDCAGILSAICGVCHSDHHLASVRAVENAAVLTEYSDDYFFEQTRIPKNAVLSRNLVLGADWAFSHAAHLLVLAGPDYHLYDLLTVLSQSVVVNSYADLLKWVIIPAQAYMHQLITLWGGKTPHQRGSVPGGNPVRPTPDVIVQSKAKLSEFRKIVDVAAPIIWNYLTARAVELSSLGTGTGNFVSMGAFQDPTTSNGTDKMPSILPRGVILYPNTTPVPFDPSQITEDTSQSWYDQASSTPVIGEQTPVPDMSKAGAYSWAKSPRYGGSVCEVGPLAREYVSGIYPKLGQVIHSVVPEVPGLPLNPKGSVFDRMVTRALELVALIGSNNTTPNLEVLGKPLNVSLVDVLRALELPEKGLMEAWLDAMDVGARAYVPYKNPQDAEGIGLWEAPRGALFHWIRIRSQKVDNYQVISPTTWNVSPNGPLERALIGTPVAETGTNEDLRAAAYVVRSFDLCLACTVHSVDARGNERYLRVGL